MGELKGFEKHFYFQLSYIIEQQEKRTRSFGLSEATRHLLEKHLLKRKLHFVNDNNKVFSYRLEEELHINELEAIRNYLGFLVL